VPNNNNWLPLIVALCFVVAFVLAQVLPSLRPSRRWVQKRTNDTRPPRNMKTALARALLALLVSVCVIAALFYAIPTPHLFRGVAAIALVLVTGAVLTSRLVFARWGRRKP